MLKENEDALEGTVKLLSQPGEEDAQVTGMTAAEARRFPIPRPDGIYPGGACRSS